MSATSAILMARAPVQRAAGDFEIRRSWVVAALAFVSSQVVLAIAMKQLPVVATIHAVTCMGGGVIYALTTSRLRRIAVIVAYVAGCEVLWRMNRADVFYEFGKYAVIAILLVALVRLRSPRNRLLALAYIGLLLPSVALTFTSLDWDNARQQVAFNMSGPVAIMISIVFFSNIRLSQNEERVTLLALIGPVCGIGALTAISTSSTELDFGNGSNMVASGGFGPNQVSSMLGLALMFLLLISVQRRFPWRLRMPAMVLAAIFATLAALTFARGGLVLALAGTAGAMFVLMRRSRRGRMTVVLVALLSVVLGKYVIEPRLDELTNGKLSERYSSTTSSGRDIYAGSELDMFESHPLLGVGPGVGTQLREEEGMIGAASHTEYTRMLAEHGVLGAISLMCLVLLAVRATRKPGDLNARANATAMVLWTALFMAIYGLRIVAPAVVLGLAFPLTRTNSSDTRIGS